MRIRPQRGYARRPLWLWPTDEGWGWIGVAVLALAIGIIGLIGRSW
jgi:hypothetical protein